MVIYSTILPLLSFYDTDTQIAAYVNLTWDFSAACGLKIDENQSAYDDCVEVN